MRSWSPEQKAEALALWTDQGPAAAARATGIPEGTIASWAHREGLQSVANERTAAMMEGARLSLAQRKAALAAKLAEVAELGVSLQLEMLYGSEVSLRDVVGASTRAIHDMLLLTGEATARTETITDRTPVNEEELAEVVEMFTTEAA